MLLVPINNCLILDKNSKLTIRQGITSNHPELETIQSNSIKSILIKNYVVSMSTGFYVSFNGNFANDSRLALVYTSFSYIGNNSEKYSNFY